MARNSVRSVMKTTQGFSRLIGALAGLAMMGMAGAANAALIEMNFTAVFDNNPPQEIVSGDFTWLAASPTATIDTLVSVSLTILGHTYTLEEIGFLSPISPCCDLIGGEISLVNSIDDSADDFWIIWFRDSGLPQELKYSTADTFGNVITGEFTSFSIVGDSDPDPMVSVPEPSTPTIFAIGLAGLGFMMRRHRSMQLKAA